MARKPATTNTTGVRITGGRWRSRRLKVADVPALRPSSDRTRETLFNWLGHNLSGQRAVDLFAGSGVLGFEALSRGAVGCEFVESNARAIAGLQTAASVFELEAPECVINPMAVKQWLAQSNASFDLVFADPPFAQGGWTELLENLTERLGPNARIYVESPTSAVWTWPSGYSLLKETRVGEAALRLLGWAGQP